MSSRPEQLDRTTTTTLTGSVRPFRTSGSELKAIVNSLLQHFRRRSRRRAIRQTTTVRHTLLHPFRCQFVVHFSIAIRTNKPTNDQRILSSLGLTRPPLLQESLRSSVWPLSNVYFTSGRFFASFFPDQRLFRSQLLHFDHCK
jgi:hypothetical protein